VDSEPTRKERWLRRWQWFRARYFVVDPRTLGLMRIVIGLLLCADCVRHWAVSRLYYSNDGVLTNHYLLFRPSSEFNFSLFSMFSSPEEVHVAFGLSFICYFLFAIGWRARLFNVLSCIWVTSMDNRLVLVENGGYCVVNLVVFWLMFLPTGQRFSVDSWRRSWRERYGRTIAEIAERHRPSWLTEPRISLGAFILFANFAFIYFFNVVNKYGDTWRWGKTVQYVLHLDRMVTGLAVPLREWMPYRVLQLSSWATLVVEALIVMTMCWPTHRLLARPVAMVLIFLLHTAFGVLMRLGPFSWFMIAWSTVLLGRAHWEALERWYRRRVEVVSVLLRPSSHLALWLARVLTRLDRAERLELAPGEDDAPVMCVRQGERVISGAEAWWAIVRALPCGIALAPVLRLCTLGLVGPVWRLLERHHERVAEIFGLDREPRAAGAKLKWPEHAVRIKTGAREVLLGYLVLCAADEMWLENVSIPPEIVVPKLGWKIPLKHKQPKIVRATITYPRLYQGWGMFAPNPVREDGIVAVDGYTIDGRRVDPFTGKEPDLDLSDAKGLGLGQIQQDYFNRVRLDRNRVYHHPLREYLAQWHKRTGNPSDELIAFDVYWLRDECPEPGRVKPTNHEKVCLLSWRKQGAVRPPGTTLPPRCKETSGEMKDNK
jgi:hypothetical protein